MCEECYVDEFRRTPLLKPDDCLSQHTQYICGTCGRCICIERDPLRGLQRWNFPFRSLDMARLYLRTADYTVKKACGIYEITHRNNRISYKIFADQSSLQTYIKRNPNTLCKGMCPVFTIGEYKEFPHTRIKRLTDEERHIYLSQRL